MIAGVPNSLRMVTCPVSSPRVFRLSSLAPASSARGTLQASPCHHGLDSLGAHHRPQAGPPGRPALVVHDRGDEGESFSRRADAGHLDIVAQFRLQNILGLEGVFAPEMSGVLELRLAVIDEEVHRLR